MPSGVLPIREYLKVNTPAFLGISFELFIILALVFANGFFVAAEFALVKVRLSQLQPMRKNGDFRVFFAIKATERLDGVLSATQLGITLTSLSLGWLGEPFVAKRIAPVLAWGGITDPAVVSSVSTVAGLCFITFFHIVLGELAPKSLAIQRAMPVSLWTAAPLMFFYLLFYPFIWALNSSANLLLRIAGLRPADETKTTFSSDELEYVFSHASEHSTAGALVNRLMVQSLRVRETTARQIMIPREQVQALWLNKSISENLKIARQAGRSRFPVCAGDMDEVRGLILIREWLWQMQTLDEDCSFEPLIREILRFRLSTTVPDMIERFRAARSHMAVVLDEQQKLAGIVTFEDVLEEIIGDIRDELDRGLGHVFTRDAMRIVVHGDMSMRELQAETGWDFDASPVETVAEWMKRHMEHFPRRNDETMIGEFRVVAEEVAATHIRRVCIERIEENPKQGEEDESKSDKTSD